MASHIFIYFWGDANIMKIQFVILLTLSLIACQEESTDQAGPEPETVANSEGGDTIPVVEELNIPTSSQPAWMDGFQTREVELLVIDSIFLAKLEDRKDTSHRFSALTVAALRRNLAQLPEDMLSTWELDDVMKIDSLLERGGYQDYLESLDLAMTESAYAFPLFRWPLSDSSCALLWYTSYSSYPACPSFSGVKVYLSLVENDKVRYCVQVGCQSRSADAPYWQSVTLHSRIDKNLNMRYTFEQENGGEEDEQGEEIIERETKEFMWSHEEGKG